jgi:DNA processing protein
MMMGVGRLLETVLALMLSEDYPRRRIIRILRDLNTEGPRMGNEALLLDLKPDPGGIVEASRNGTPEARRLLDELGRQGVGITCLADAAYPALLKEIHSPPPILFHKGDLPDTAAGAVAIVGSRRASLGGMRLAARLAGDLARWGFTIVSGLARGIDTAAHQGALEAGGRTIAVLGCGIDLVYPPENAGLARAIAGSGAAVTEFMPGVQPLRPNFPQRNRIISGLCLGTIVVEAGERSGALITASCALDQNRSVFAVPGAPGFYGSRGTNALLKQGARLVESVDDVLEELAPQVMPPARSTTPDLSAEGENASEARLIDLLSTTPVHVDELCRSLDVTPREVLNMLFLLETRGLVRSLPGKFYIRDGAV